MSAELAFIFSNVFDTIFDYDEKYNELCFKKGITTQTITEDINSRSKGLRDIWYRCYPALMKYYKLYSVYSEEHLLNAIEYDNAYAFIPNAFITQEMLKEHIFIKPIEQDYNFERLTEQNDRDHYDLTYPVKYTNGLNFDSYAERGLININRSVDMLNKMNVKWSIEYLNSKDPDHEVVSWRLYNEPNFRELFGMITDDSVKTKVAKFITKNVKNITVAELIPYTDILRDYRSFDFKNTDISRLVTREMAEQFKKTKDGLNRLKESFDFCLKYQHSAEYLDCVLVNGNTKQWLTASFMNDDQTVDRMVQQRPQFAVSYVSECIRRKSVDRSNFDEYVKRFSLNEREHKFDIGFAWVEAHKEEPPLNFYPDPNYREQSSIDRQNPSRPWQKGITIADCWAQYVNERTTPMEMKSMKYYDYMVKSNGVKRNPNQTIMYSYFSNSNENKLIFCKSDIELLDPAVPRYYIPVEFKKLKQYLHEDLLTTDICMFAQLTKNDWEKIAGGKDDIDIVAFNDMKNVYRERTPLKEVIGYLIENINIEYEVECQKAGL